LSAYQKTFGLKYRTKALINTASSGWITPQLTWKSKISSTRKTKIL